MFPIPCRCMVEDMVILEDDGLRKPKKLNYESSHVWRINLNSVVTEFMYKRIVSGNIKENDEHANVLN